MEENNEELLEKYGKEIKQLKFKFIEFITIVKKILYDLIIVIKNEKHQDYIKEINQLIIEISKIAED